jgi:hypothetical protein
MWTLWLSAVAPDLAAPKATGPACTLPIELGGSVNAAQASAVTAARV